MYRILLVTFGCICVVAGCAQPQHPMEMPKKPSPAPELAKLQCFVGT